MIKEYYHPSGERITEQEAIQLNEYRIRFIDHLFDLPFKEEHHIIESKVYSIEYFIYDDENESDISDHLSRKTKLFEIRKRVVAGDFVVDTVSNGVLLVKYVYNAENIEFTHYICQYVLDRETHLPQRVTKYWYDVDKDGELYEAIEFSYHEDGSLREVIDKKDGHSDEQYWNYYDEFQDLQNLKSIDLSYYKNADLLPSNLNT